jgi:hypothetical protein
MHFRAERLAGEGEQDFQDRALRRVPRKPNGVVVLVEEMA